jgi:hypothetical protein
MRCLNVSWGQDQEELKMNLTRIGCVARLAISEFTNRFPKSLYAVALSLTLILMFCDTNLRAQDSPANRIQSHMRSGEFSSALRAAGGMGDRQQADMWRSRIAQQQSQSGAAYGSYHTASQVNDDQLRNQTLFGIRQSNDGPKPGAGGGITAADFTELIQLIESTIQPDSWDSAEGLGTIRAYPSGVFVDAKGTMKKLKSSDKINWSELRRSMRMDLDEDAAIADAQLRKISLTRLERQLQVLAAQGKQPADEMKYLGGIYEVKYLLFYPETGDIVIAGPAGPWQLDNQGRALNAKTGKPVLLLDDLVVCLRNAFEDDGNFGCSIDPTEKNLKLTNDFLASSKLKGESWRKKLRETVGQQLITVHGIDRQSHAARVIVEADYRMKLIGMGLEPSVSEVPSYLDRIRLDENGNPPPMDLARWWFTLNYDSVRASEKRDAFSFNGNAVRLQSESEALDVRGQRIHTGKSSRENQSYADDFTKHFDKLAEKYPIYNELKNVFDLAVVSALIRHEDLNGKLKWRLTYFGTPASAQQLTYEIARDRLPKTVESVMNFREIEARKRTKRVRHTIVGVSGGVIFGAGKVVNKKSIVEQASMNKHHRSNVPSTTEPQNWWWD